MKEVRRSEGLRPKFRLQLFLAVAFILALSSGDVQHRRVVQEGRLVRGVSGHVVGVKQGDAGRSERGEDGLGVGCLEESRRIVWGSEMRIVEGERCGA